MKTRDPQTAGGNPEAGIPGPGAQEQSTRREDEILSSLGLSRVPAPTDLAAGIMAALPPGPGRSLRDRLAGLWPRQTREWLIPSLSGAMAAALLLIGIVGLLVRPGAKQSITVSFELHAPEAQRVELVGTFNDWEPGQIVLSGPDATGHWTATVELPAGRHEYVFLVDGRRWVTDPKATIVRPDGFGRENAVLEI